MSEFSITEAAFSGLRLAARRPVAILVWGLFYFALSIGLAALMASMAGPAIMEMQTIQAQTRADPSSANPGAMLALFGQIIPFYLMLIPISLLAGAIAIAAVTRANLRPAEAGFAYLRLGADELRLAIVSLVIGVVMFAVYIGGVIVLAITGAALRAASGGAASLTVVIGLGCLLALLLLYVGTRFALAPALTLDRRSINIFGSFALTKGRAGKVFLACLLALAVNLVIFALGLSIVAGVAAALAGGVAGALGLFRPDMSSLTTLFTPIELLYYLVTSFLGGLGLAIMASPPAFIYQALVRDGVDQIL
jgi:hypothetical protein